MINPFDPATFAIVGILTLACIFVPFVRRVSEWFVTIIHEVGHAVASVATGGGIHSIKLRMNGGGETTTLNSVGFFSWFRRVFVLFAGYNTPIFLGLLLVWGVRSGHTQVMFYILLGTALLTLIFIRNFFGLLIVILYFLFLGLGMVISQAFFLPAVLVFFGLLLTVRGIVDLILAGRLVFVDNHGGTDFDLLADSSIIRIPAKVWYVIYTVTITLQFVVALAFVWITAVSP